MSRPTIILEFTHDIKVMPREEAKIFCGATVGHWPMGWYVFKGDTQVDYHQWLQPAIAKAEQLEYLENLKHSS